MLRKEIQIALEAAAKISPHHQFVIAGSLSVLGYSETPPVAMSLSIDIDFFPLQDPGHVAEIADALGEDSEFHETHGYYLDPISSDLPVLPSGWKDRLVEVKLGEVFAYFLDVHDTAISKYARGAENDYRWIDAGYRAGILSFETIEAWARFGTDYPGVDDKEKVRCGIESHRVAFMPDGKLNAELLEYLRSDSVRNVFSVDDESGRYVGKIVWIGNDRVVQMVSDFGVAVHATNALTEHLQIGRIYAIQYENGKASLRGVDVLD